jgi:hypothetical protein
MDSFQNPPRIFVSYSTADKTLAGQVRAHFAQAGFSVFLAHEDMQPSEDFIARIRSELVECNVFIPLLTDKFRSSPWTDQEVGLALSRSKLGKDACLILPLVFAPTALPPHGFIKDVQAIRITEPNQLESAVLQAVAAIDLKLGLAPFRREKAISAFCASQSFASAKQNADKLWAFAPFTFQEATRLAQASVTNNQIYLPVELRSRVKRLLGLHISGLDPLLKAQLDDRFP